MKFSKIVSLSIAVACIAFAADCSAQIFGRRVVRQEPACTGPNCQPVVVDPVYLPPIVQSPVVPEQVKTSEAEEVQIAQTAVAKTPHVRCIFNGSCGSGTICGVDGRGAYVLTNAHVVGTQIGRVATVDCVTDQGTRRVRGRIVMSGYSDRTMVDFAILHCEGLTSERYMPLLKGQPEAAPYGTTGSPRCVWPQVVKDFRDPRNYGDGLITGLPDAIGGQSGSAIYNSNGQQIALLTWSIGGRCAGQKTAKLWQVAQQRNVNLADPRPEGLVEVQEGPRPQTDSGIFGECELVAEAIDRPETESGCHGFPVAFPATNREKIGALANGVQNIVGSAMAELPIWYEPPKPGQPTPPTPNEPKPDEDDCYKLTPDEWELIEFLRKQSEERGIGNRSIDWMKLLPLILEIIRIIQEGRGK